LTFTAENEGGSFERGNTPVDLFFLFDASASQNNQMGKMLESAKQIVKMFAGDENNKDICHVGSALFLGNNIQLMCSSQIDTLSQTIWSKIES